MQDNGKNFRDLIINDPPLQVLGTINAYSALLAKRQGAKAIYLSGAGVANASLGLPDLGITTLQDVLEDASRITAAQDLPLLVDIDTGWGNEFNIARAIKLLEKAGVAAVHIEDQSSNKRCGHRPGKKIVSTEEMVARIKACVDARTNENFVIMARSDAFVNEGMNGLIDRCGAYIEAGADMLFPEALTSLSEYKQITEAINVPVLANITEFGKTPLFTKDELSCVGIKIILYPLSAFRAMSKACGEVYKTILSEGTQQNILDDMQTRNELYDVLDYHAYEEKLNQ